MPHYLFLGGGGFLGNSLIEYFQATTTGNTITVFDNAECPHLKNQVDYCVTGNFCEYQDFDTLVQGVDVVYHLISTSRPSSVIDSPFQDLEQNVAPTLRLLDACVKANVKKVVFLSSGGTVYGIGSNKPFVETAPLQPINYYGIQKVLIEKYLYLYYVKNGLDYRVIRLSNPYGPNQKPNSGLGAITTFAYRALRKDPIEIYGSGETVRDYIYIDDVLRGIRAIECADSPYKTFNLGSGTGTSLNQIISTLSDILGYAVDVSYLHARKEDVPYSVLDITRFQKTAKQRDFVSLEAGINHMLDFFRAELAKDAIG